MCHILIPLLLYHKIFNLMHVTPITGHMSEYKPYIVFAYSFCVLILKNRSKNFIIVHLYTAGDNVIKD